MFNLQVAGMIYSIFILKTQYRTLQIFSVTPPYRRLIQHHLLPTCTVRSFQQVSSLVLPLPPKTSSSVSLLNQSQCTFKTAGVFIAICQHVTQYVRQKKRKVVKRFLSLCTLLGNNSSSTIQQSFWTLQLSLALRITSRAS